MTMEDKKFNEITDVLPSGIKNVLRYIPENIKAETYEIRIRQNKPVTIFGKYGIYFVKKDSTVSAVDFVGSLKVSGSDIKSVVSSLCGYSVYSHQNDITQGFVTFGNGHRAGFSGTAVYNGTLTALRDIDGVNIRIAREFDNSADKLLDLLTGKNFSGIIVAGEPCSGKTTVLRSFASKISSLYAYGYKKTVIIDERYEMGNVNAVNCDVLRGFSKTDGIIHATRVLSPEIIVCDEITTVKEAEQIIRSCYTGVRFAVSVHIGNVKDIFQRPVSKILTDSSFFDYIVFLKNSSSAGEIDLIAKTEDLKNELHRNDCSNDKLGFSRIYDCPTGNQALQGLGNSTRIDFVYQK